MYRNAKRSKKGMALANTLILMCIVFMLSALMMTMMMYNVSQTNLATSEFEYEAELNAIANDFCEYQGGMLQRYLMLDANGMQQLDEHGDVLSDYGYVPIEGGGVEPNSIRSINRVITITQVGSAALRLTITNRQVTNDVLMTVVLSNGIVTAWCYGELP